MKRAEWLKAKIHIDNHSQLFGGYQSVELGGGCFSVHEQDRIKDERAKVLVLGAVGLSIAETSLALSTSIAGVKSNRTTVFRELEAVNMIHSVTRSFERGVLQVEKEAVLPDKAEIDPDFLFAIANGMFSKECPGKASLDFPDITAMCNAAEANFEQPNMAGVVTLAHLARLL